MATNLPKVPVTRTEAGGFLITCRDYACRNFRTLRATRLAADLVATEHLKTHAARQPRFEEDQTS